MNKVIYRAWIENGQGQQMILPEEYGLQGLYSLIMNYCVSFLPQKVELMLYSGFKDKDGNDVCQGDIVSWAGTNYVIEFCPDATHPGFYMRDPIDGTYTIPPFPVLQVVGNIKQHPSLIGIQR